MKKLFTRVFAVAMVLAAGSFSCLLAQGPQMPQLPVDSAVRVGKLPNGMTYYIRHNETPKGQADFYIAQKVGSVLEEDHQRGLAHFLEHMCFNGTTNFPGKGIINWLETVGVKFGQNLNAYTGVDETVYNISNVPVARKSVQDSCLLILHDWACDLTLADDEIDAERAVIHEEWRQSMKGNMRIMEAIAPKIYPGNKYGERLPIGTMEVVDNFPYQALKDYYHKWYRPDQQGIIVVGDIDPDYIEAKIKEIFTPIKMPANPAERIYLQVEDTPGTIYAVGS
ncbi:MAG: insulinase family protein, partial [Muribaculaceae bacterium]|nr:insulinase family protein [Muribaculaceae bacterium]